MKFTIRDIFLLTGVVACFGAIAGLYPEHTRVRQMAFSVIMLAVVLFVLWSVDRWGMRSSTRVELAF